MREFYVESMFGIEKLIDPLLGIARTLDQMATAASIQNAADAKTETSRRLAAYAALAEAKPTTEDRTIPHSA